MFHVVERLYGGVSGACIGGMWCFRVRLMGVVWWLRGLLDPGVCLDL